VTAPAPLHRRCATSIPAAIACHAGALERRLSYWYKSFTPIQADDVNSTLQKPETVPQTEVPATATAPAATAAAPRRAARKAAPVGKVTRSAAARTAAPRETASVRSAPAEAARAKAVKHKTAVTAPVITAPVITAPVITAPVAAAAKPAKAKSKLVRDSFTMPQADFDLIGALKDRALGFKRPTKKSELLRAGLHTLLALNAAQLRSALDALVPLKPGRPKNVS